MLMISQPKVNTVLLNKRTDAPLNPTTQLYSLKNTAQLCYRNSVLHSLFSIDSFLNLLESGGSTTQNAVPAIPLYGQLLRAAKQFRGGNQTEFRGAANNAWSTMIKTDPTTRAENRDEGIVDKRWDPNDSGRQEDAGALFDYLMFRLCETELNPDQRG